MPRTPAAPKTIGEKLAELLDRLVGGLAQPLRPAPAPVPVPVRQPGTVRNAYRQK